MPGSKERRLPTGLESQDHLKEKKIKEAWNADNGTVPLAILWDYIRWDKIESKVYRIQTCIEKYLKQGKLRQVKKLQRLLRNFYRAILLAIKRVTSNKGKRTKAVVVKFLAECGLTLSEEKTVVTHMDDGFDFLGFNIRSYKGKVLTKPSKAGIASVLKTRLGQLLLTCCE
jgi:retron-type reverse transcriptase